MRKPDMKQTHPYFAEFPDDYLPALPKKHSARQRLNSGAVGLIITALIAAVGYKTESMRNEVQAEETVVNTISAQDNTQIANEGRLLARPQLNKENRSAAPHGLVNLKFGNGRDGQLYVPTSYRVDRPAPFVLLLHGAGGSSTNGLNPLRAQAEKAGLILLAPDSRGRTWDVILGAYGPDVEFIDRALKHVFERYNIDRSRLTVGGFSDGASYALSLGIINGDLFSHVIAFSPGFMAPTAQRGAPRLFISHGTKDRVLPIDKCSRAIAPRVKKAGYQVLYQEFDGPHTVPAEIARQSVHWLTTTEKQKSEQ
jgi:predicted esterase